MRLTEDEIYRSSTQFRIWSYTADALASLRSSTNVTASQRVKAAVRRHREARKESASNSEAEKTGAENGATPTAILEKEVDCLTLEEEQKVVDAYCKQAIRLGEFFNFPINVIVSSIPYVGSLSSDLIVTVVLGNGSTIFEALLLIQLAHDLRAKGHHAERHVSCHQD